MENDYNPDWFLEVIAEAKRNDPSLRKQRELVETLENQIKKMKPLKIKPNGDADSKNTNFYFVDPINPNQSGSDWQHQTCIRFDGDHAHLIVDVLKKDRLGAIELWRRANLMVTFGNSSI